MPSSKPSRRRLGREALRAWYVPRRRAYPWRGSYDPYAVWVSEVMLQQTQAGRVVPAFRSFLRRFPTVPTLAAAPRRDVVREWGGLGYNRRAVNLHRAAERIAAKGWPDDLTELPGVGPYTAAAVSSVAFGSAVAAVDTNARRLVARFFLGVEPDAVSPREIHALADAWLDRRDPGAWNQAVMDLGREVCRPNPRCDACPLSRVCRFHLAGSIAARGRGRQGPFEGSGRQVRGAVVRVLRSHPSLTRARLSEETGFSPERIDAAVGSLTTDGLVEDDGGAVRLAE